MITVMLVTVHTQQALATGVEGGTAALTTAVSSQSDIQHKRSQEHQFKLLLHTPHK
jgi:hypothetical protein